MKRVVYLCFVLLTNFNTMAQDDYITNPYDTICHYLTKYLKYNFDATQQPREDGWIYNSVYSDEFNGTNLNTTKWKCWDHFYHPNNPLVGYLRDNVHLSDGKLVLSAKHDVITQLYTSYNDSNGVYLEFSSGAIESKQKIRYGYFEAECYYPKNHNFRPCFWTVGGMENYYDEVDVLEIVPEDSSAYRFQQNEYSNLETASESLAKQKLLSSDSITGKTIRLGVEILPYEIVFYINGQVSSQLVYNRDYADDLNIFTCTDITKTVPMNIIFSFIITLVNNNIPQPYENFIVDYFRCYKLDRGIVNTYNPGVFIPSSESCKVYPNVILGGNGHTAYINSSTAVWAEQSIVFDTGFEVSANTRFSARIINHGNENPELSPLYIENCPH